MVNSKFISVEVCPVTFDVKSYLKLRLPDSKPWTEKDWAIHEKIFNRLAQPKKNHSDPEPAPRQKKPLVELLPRLKKLAEPKRRKSGRYVPKSVF